MFWKLLALFTILPVLELTILIRLGSTLGLLSTLIIVLGTGIAGAYLAKTQGWAIMYSIQKELNQGIMPGKQLVEGLCVLAGGLLLLTPGLITDIIGLALVMPGTRNIFRDLIIQWMRGKLERGDFHIHIGK